MTVQNRLKDFRAWLVDDESRLQNIHYRPGRSAPSTTSGEGIYSFNDHANWHNSPHNPAVWKDFANWANGG